VRQVDAKREQRLPCEAVGFGGSARATYDVSEDLGRMLTTLRPCCSGSRLTAVAIVAPVRLNERDDEGEETGERRVFFRTAYAVDT
jgi:hypothetical protein